MKKFLIVLCLLFVGCVGDQPSNRNPTETPQEHFSRVGFYTYDQEIEGMKYRTLYNKYSGGSIAVINITKDKLEVEALKKQLGK